MNDKAERALADALAALGADSGTIHLAEGKLLRLAAWAGPMPEPVLNVIREIPWGKGMAGQAAERVEPIGTCNLQTTTQPEVRPGAKATQLRGALVVPMLLGDEVVGTFGVGCNGERIFTAKETRDLWERGRKLARQLAPDPRESLRGILASRVSSEAMSWLETASDIREAFPAVSRKLGRDPLGARGALVRADGEEVPLGAWRTDDAGRALLILRDRSLLRDLYFQGDLRERAGALRALAVVGDSDASIDLVLDAMRLAADELVDAALADNPYASKFLPQHEFRRAVLKCAFVGIPVTRVSLIEQRADEELTRMLLGLVAEREAAARAVPPELWPVCAQSPTPGLFAKLVGYLEHAMPEHRINAARGLGRVDDERARAFLEDRLARESDATVKRAIDWALA